ncbi:MAG TPA: hypothetical protein VIL09_13590 [Microvirga sp.]|jgi:chemotaxis regulatin CheY-phosphate phosphatase CheZ
MADARALTPISEADYEAIEAAVMETDRGRWFLREYSRRNRTADTEMLLDAIGRLEQAVAGERVAQDVDRLRVHLKEMAAAISRTKSEIASIHQVEQEHSRLFAASEALDGITRQTELATSDILAAAEHIQECAWTLREEGGNPELCDELDRRATEIYTACSFQDLTAQRIAKIIHTLRYLEGRINAMIAIWDGSPADLQDGGDAPFAHAPATADLTQSDIDSVIVDEDLFGVASATLDREEPQDHGIAAIPEPPHAAAPSPADDAAVVAFADAQGWDSAAPVASTDAANLDGAADFASVEAVDWDDAASVAQVDEEDWGSPAAVRPDRASALAPDDEIAFADAMSEVAEAMGAPVAAAPAPAPEPQPRIRLDAFRQVDALPTREKLRLFT